MRPDISVVIPTYNRADQLGVVLDRLLESDVGGLDAVEIIVVDDGSSVRAEAVVSGKSAGDKFDLKYIYQPNAGPARARNNGYRNSSGEIVLFMDDDILVSTGLLAGHVAAHREFPGSVIMGPYPCAAPEREGPSWRFVKMLEQSALDAMPERGFIATDTVASGNLSIERQMFTADDGLYDDSLNSPTAEEFDIIAKLRRRKIPVYFGRELSAIHLQLTTIEETCKREYKHATGIGELAVKRPELADELDEIDNFLEVNRSGHAGDSTNERLKRWMKNAASADAPRAMFLTFVKIAERMIPNDRLMFPLFRIAVGLHIFAGVRDGKLRFSGGGEKNR